jgi:hypothetical protein
MASVEKSRCAATAIAPGLIALAVQKTPQRSQLQYVVLRVEMRCINRGFSAVVAAKNVKRLPFRWPYLT